MSKLHSCLSYDIYQDAITTAKNIFIIIRSLLSKGFIYSFLKTMWDHTDGCAKQYHCKSYVYLLSCIALEIFIIIYRSVGAHGHGSDVVDVINSRDKWMLMLSMEKILNTELIYNNPTF